LGTDAEDSDRPAYADLLDASSILEVVRPALNAQLAAIVDLFDPVLIPTMVFGQTVLLLEEQESQSHHNLISNPQSTKAATESIEASDSSSCERSGVQGPFVSASGVSSHYG
jgi:hypothetical protein